MNIQGYFRILILAIAVSGPRASAGNRAWLDCWQAISDRSATSEMDPARIRALNAQTPPGTTVESLSVPQSARLLVIRGEPVIVVSNIRTASGGPVELSDRPLRERLQASTQLVAADGAWSLAYAPTVGLTRKDRYFALSVSLAPIAGGKYSSVYLVHQYGASECPEGACLRSLRTIARDSIPNTRENVVVGARKVRDDQVDSLLVSHARTTFRQAAQRIHWHLKHQDPAAPGDSARDFIDRLRKSVDATLERCAKFPEVAKELGELKDAWTQYQQANQKLQPITGKHEVDAAFQPVQVGK